MKKYSLLFAFVIATVTMYGQWNPTSQGLPEKANVKIIVVKDGVMFAAASEGLFASADNGATWEKKNLNDKKAIPYLQTLVVAGDSIFAGGSDFVYVSPDKGKTWGLAERTPNSMYFEKIYAKGYTLIYGCYDGLYYSFNKGIYWDEITGNIKRETFLDDDGEETKVKSIQHFIIIDKSIFAATSSGIYLSNDRGKTWEPRSQGLPKKSRIHFLEMIGDNFFCSNGDGIYVSADQGKSWKKAESSIPKNTRVNNVVSDGKILYAAVWQKGVYTSTDNGSTWLPFNAGLPKKFTAWNLMVHNNKLYAGGINGGVWITDLASAAPVGK